MDAIFSFLADHFPTIGVLLVGCFIGGLAVKYYMILKDTKKKVDVLPCDEHDKRLDTIDARLNLLPCNPHSDAIKEISIWVMKKDKLMIPKIAGGQSPIRLKPPGTALLEISGGKKCIDENRAFFISTLEKNEPKTPYDVEQRAIGVVQDSMGLEIFNQIKNFLYFNQEKELAGEKIEISMFTVVYVMGIYLRDIYLEKHPEIMPEMERMA